jgi:hypothetical protein
MLIFPSLKLKMCTIFYKINLLKVASSVADSGCLSRILIFIHPGWRIRDLATATKEEWENKCFPTFVVATNIKILKLFYI